MKKILFLLLVTISGYGQTLPNANFGNTTTNTLKIKTPATVTSVNFLNTVEIDGSIAKISPVNLPLTKIQNIIDVYLIAGQSNILGSSTDPASSPTVKAGTGYQYYLGSITAITNNVGAGNGGAWPSFINELYIKNQRKILMVPTAVGSTSQTAAANTGSGTWDTSGTLFSNSVTQVNQAMAAASASGYTPVFKGVLWGQGETDAGALFAGTITKADYYNAFFLMINNYRVTFGDTMPFYIFRTGGQPTNTGFIPIRASQDEIADLQPYTYMVYRNAVTFFARSLMRPDNLHYTQAGYNEMGAMGADAVNALDKYSRITNQYNQIGIGISEPQSALDLGGDGTMSVNGQPKVYGSANGIGLNGGVNEADQINASATKFASAIPVWDFHSSVPTNAGPYQDLIYIRHPGSATSSSALRSLALLFHLSNNTTAGESDKSGGFELRSNNPFASIPKMYWFVGNKDHIRLGYNGDFSMGLNNNAPFNYFNNYTDDTNNESVSLTYAGARFNLIATKLGTGVQNEFAIGVPNRQLLFNNVGTGTGGYFLEYPSGSSANNQKFIGFTSSISSNSGSNPFFNIRPVINQTGTAGFSALAIYPTETTVGSGIKNIIDFGVGSTQIMSLQSNGLFNIGGVNGLSFGTSNNYLYLGTAPTTGVSTLGLFREGDGRISGRSVYDAATSDTRYVQPSRNITVSLPLTGGGNLGADRFVNLGGLSTYGTAGQSMRMNTGATGFEYYDPLFSPLFTGDPKAPTPTAGDNDTSIPTTAFVATALAAKKNEAGQVKINYTGLNTTAFIADVVKTLDINAATPTVVSSPTTTYPNSTPNNYGGVFASSRGTSPTGRLIENPINGQVHTWRFQLTYSGKASPNNGSLDLILTNPVSGFQYVMPFTLPSGRTTGVINSLAITIADSASIPSPNGYILQAVTSFTDATLAVNVDSITRISNAIED